MELLLVEVGISSSTVSWPIAVSECGLRGSGSVETAERSSSSDVTYTVFSL